MLLSQNVFAVYDVARHPWSQVSLTSTQILVERKIAPFTQSKEKLPRAEALIQRVIR